jgi:hypothetical protein
MIRMPRYRALSLEELSRLLPRIKATVAALTGRAAASHAAPAAHAGNGRRGPKPGAGRVARTRKGSAAGAKIAEKLYGALKAGKKGFGLGDLVKRTGASTSQVKYHLRRLRAQKKARVVGDRKKARWFAS